MAKETRSISFRNAVISKADRTITEVFKDDTKTYPLSKLINDWDGITGVSITFKKDEDIESIEVEDGEDE